MGELKQIDTYDTIIGKIVKDYDANFKNIRTYQENDKIYFMAKDVIKYIKGNLNNKNTVLKVFNNKEVIQKQVKINDTNRTYNCNLVTIYGMIRCISICSDTKAGIALREFIYILFDTLTQESTALSEHKIAMESAEITEELKQVESDLTGGIVYFIKDSQSGYVKIGRTDDDISIRLTQLQVGNPSELTVCKTIECNSREVEKKLHEQFADKHIRGEWFNITDVDIESCK
jgi:hypothetical protein